MNIPDVKLKDKVHINGRHFDPIISRMITVTRLTAPSLVGNVLWITSANDGKHKDTSKHYTNEAFDVRIRNVKGLKWGVRMEFVYNEVVKAWADQIELALGKGYDIVYGDAKHLSHIHIEYDPK